MENENLNLNPIDIHEDVIHQKKSNFRFVIVMAYAIVTSLYIPTGLFGLTYFLETSPDNFPRDLLTGFKTNEILANVARVCMAGAAVCCYPLNHFPARCAIFNVYKTFTGKDVEKMKPSSKDIYYLVEIVIFIALILYNVFNGVKTWS